MTKQANIPELLAPAGNLLSGVTALDCGADAVYAGLPKFNARERTENLSYDDLAKLINYAHANSKKTYLVLNTLIKEAELTDVAEILANVVDMKPDAIIVQDIGLVHLIRTYFPTLAIHASTQMGIHNSAGIIAAETLGISRVILERQVTLNELKSIMQKTPIEVEIFVHGALCCSLSGVCLFSSWVSGSSGNRGKCLQLCRRKFNGKNDDTGFYLSPKDLCLLDMIPELKEMGIHSLKIEGRLRKPDYIKNVVSAYRLMLDANESTYSQSLETAKGFLANTASRTASPGFISTKSMHTVIDKKTPGVAGIAIGKPIKIKRGGIEIKLKRRLHIGDKIRAQNANGDASKIITVSDIRVNGQKSTKAGQGMSCFIPTDVSIPAGSIFYKTGESYKEQAAKLAAIPVKQPLTVNLDVTINSTGFKITLPGVSDCGCWTHQRCIEPAQKHSLNTTQIATEFSKTGNKNWKTGTIECKIDGALFIPASILKTVRKDFYSWLETEINAADFQQSQGDIFLKHFQSTFPCPSLKTINKPRVSTYLNSNKIEDGQSCRSIYGQFTDSDEVLLPFFCAEGNLKSLKTIIDGAYKRGVRHFRLTSLYQLALIKQYKDLTLSASYPLPICNSAAACECRNLDIANCMAWVELEKESLAGLIKNSPLPIEVFQEGNLPILITRASIAADKCFHDNRHKQYHLRFDKSMNLTFLYPDEKLKIDKYPGSNSFYSSEPTIGTDATSSFNQNTTLK